MNEQLNRAQDKWNDVAAPMQSRAESLAESMDLLNAHFDDINVQFDAIQQVKFRAMRHKKANQPYRMQLNSSGSLWPNGIVLIISIIISIRHNKYYGRI